MATDTELKNAYARGYAAGKRRKETAITAEERQRRADAAWNRAFLAALPACIAADGWTTTKADGTKEPISTRAGRVKLAAGVADDAIKHMRY